MVTNTATNGNIHSAIVSYSLMNSPKGAAISGSGIITWTPSQNQTPSTNTFATVVTDSNPYDQINPQLTATNSMKSAMRFNGSTGSCSSLNWNTGVPGPWC